MRRTGMEFRAIFRAETPTHRRYRDHLTVILVVTIGVDVICTVLAYFLERHLPEAPARSSKGAASTSTRRVNDRLAGDEALEEVPQLPLGRIGEAGVDGGGLDDGARRGGEEAEALGLAQLGQGARRGRGLPRSRPRRRARL